MYDLIIIGGGPAGVSAAVYAARKRLKTLLLTESFGGQSIDSAGIENWIGTVSISGQDLAKALEAHVRAYTDKPGNTLETAYERVEAIEKSEAGFSIKTGKNAYEAKTVLVATGSSRRKLEIPGAKEYENKGITYCASCDGPLFADQDVVVIGGGNAGFESAAQLLAYCKSVTLLNRGDVYRADEMTVENVLKHPHMKGITNAIPKEIKGTTFVSSIVYTDATTNEDHELPVTGIFVEIGLIPATGFVESLLPLNQYKQIPIDAKTQRTTVSGVWAAGDCTDTLYHQNNIAAGDAVKALEDIYLSLHTNG
ncbi:MAG: alkyl hydroperoxide reductase subunit alkyl hydroperoxide reductase subunit [Parcubacteria group bacterium]|nr:alkyl hydroperoxide reductase subunit alkyl hydroperoxide reductase subunit [Parcubacteria group bacterium]